MLEGTITEVETVAGVTITMEEDMLEGIITEVDTVEADTMEVDMVAGDAKTKQKQKQDKKEKTLVALL